MGHKSDLKREYKERVKPAGVFQIKNTANGKVLLGSTLNLEGALNREKFTLKMGSHKNRQLQSDWKEFGAENFEFEVLEEVSFKQEEVFNISDELTLLEQIWLEELNPIGEGGYNLSAKIRQV